ncbi:MAG TPA: hypothetical protein VNF73_06065 [Candidatus Saccharimonadales bacterium]|nr:hypothetical protein [Candidatus Saccharimonadales bacterium]
MRVRTSAFLAVAAALLVGSSTTAAAGPPSLGWDLGHGGAAFTVADPAAHAWRLTFRGTASLRASIMVIAIRETPVGLAGSMARVEVTPQGHWRTTDTMNLTSALRGGQEMAFVGAALIFEPPDMHVRSGGVLAVQAGDTGTRWFFSVSGATQHGSATSPWYATPAVVLPLGG